MSRMNVPAFVFVLRWLIWDTFRQALAARTFWLMTCVSAVCVLLCLSIRIEGGDPLKPAGEIELSDPVTGKPLTGRNPLPGSMSVLFGAFRVFLFRDGEAQVRFLQTFLGLLVAGTLGTLAVLVWTAGFVPAFIEPSAATVLLAKPMPRWLLLAGKFLGVCCLVAFQAGVFFVGTWLALGLSTGVWTGGFLVCLPLLLLHFVIIYSVSVVLAVFTRSAVLSIVGSVLFWALCYLVDCGRYANLVVASAEAAAPAMAPILQRLLETTYWVLPKPGDLTLLLDQALQASNHLEILPAPLRLAQRDGLYNAELSVLTSLGFAGTMLTLAVAKFARTDY